MSAQVRESYSSHAVNTAVLNPSQRFQVPHLGLLPAQVAMHLIQFLFSVTNLELLVMRPRSQFFDTATIVFSCVVERSGATSADALVWRVVVGLVVVK